METEHVQEEEVPSLDRQWELLEGDKVDRPGEAIHDSEDHGVTFGGWKARDEIHGDVGPQAPWYRQWMEEAWRGLMGGLFSGTGRAGGDKPLGVTGEGGPPKPLS